jgi:prophage regulatory protein
MSRLLAPDELRSKKGIDYSRSQLHRKVKAGTFPPPVKLGQNKNAWLEQEVDEWIQSRVAARNQPQAA